MFLKRIRKALVAVALLIFSVVSLFVVSHMALLPSSHRERMRAIRPETEKDTTLQAIWAKDHLTRLIDGLVDNRNKKIMNNNAVGKVPSPVPDIVPRVSEMYSANGRHDSPLLWRNSQSKNSQSKVMKLPGGDSKRKERGNPIPVKSVMEGNSQCTAAPASCLQADNLRSDEKERLTSCLAKAVSYVKHRRSHTGNGSLSLTKCSCHLRNNRPDNRRVALMSLPGSGNTWVRGLLEHATNICTGAMWCDPNLRATQFCGEGLHGPRTLVVKNHDPTIRWRSEPLPKKPNFSENNKPEFDAVIFLLRNPYDAMVAEHSRGIGYARWEAAVHGNRHLNFSVSHHIQSFGAEYFGDNVLWNLRVKELMKIWETMINHLLIKNKNTERVLVIKYTDLVKNTRSEVLRMLKFLGYFVTPDSLKQRMKIEFNAFKRSHGSTSFEHFTPAQKQLINTVINNVSSKLKSPIKDYIRT